MQMSVEFPALGFILLFPALGVVYHIFFGYRWGRRVDNLIGPGVILVSFAIACWAFYTLARLPPGSALTCRLWDWFASGSFHAALGLRVDALSGVMIMIVTGVGGLIHVYTCGYMGHDPDYARFFAYMNLFIVAMLFLVTGDNLVVMFLGWEGVGLCSYLLISFWHTNPQFARFGRKAFIVTRVGDVGFILAILSLVRALAPHGVWSLNFTDLQANVLLLSPITCLTVGVLLLIGAAGKSAQLPLYVWLPDAMVGPTPISALIHAATMVTAGVYMVARMHFIFDRSQFAMDLVATIGAFTCIYAGTIALVQPDIKKVLAYSTISQLGYMFLGVGVGAFSYGIFHLMTHAFFKGCLFLCAGAVMHALGGEQDMNKMGGLRRKIPITYATMFIATLAITAIPGFSGYFSKDLILEAAYTSGHTTLWLLGVTTAGITGFYMFRLLFMTFFGESRVEKDRLAHIHEAPPSMTVPLMVLAFLSIVGGYVGLPPGAAWGDAFARFLAPVVGEFHPTYEASTLFLSGCATGAGLTGILLAYLFYIRFPSLPPLLAQHAERIYDLLLEKYYVDEIYDFLISRPLFFISSVIFGRGVDSFVIDGLADGAAVTAEATGGIASRAETGNVQHYAFVYLLGAIAIAAYYLFRVLG
jgi:NADH-quinone oxidoreductase subunit L